MIDFSDITKTGIKYKMLYHYVHLVHNHVYYRKFYVLGEKNIPKDEAIVAICNHQNGLTDALGILFTFFKDGRFPIFIARSDIFRRPIAAKLLRFLKIMPAFRTLDGSTPEELEANKAIFNRSAEALMEKQVICLFPEAGHTDCRHLGPFKKGFARIAFQAAEMSDFKEPIKILPMGHHYSTYFSIQGQLMITVGEPFEFSDLYDLYKEHPQKAQKILTDRARIRVKELMLDIEDLDYYEQYDILRQIYDKDLLKAQKLRPTLPNQLQADKRIVAAIDQLRSDEPTRFDTLMKQSLAYIRNLEKLHLHDWIIKEKVSFWGFLFRLLLAIVLLPFIVFGFINNFIPFNASTLITRRIEDQMLHSSFHFVIGALFAFPLWYLLIFIVVWATTATWWIALAYCAILPLSLIMYLRTKVLWIKVFNRMRRFHFWFIGRKEYKEAVKQRQSLVKTLKKIVGEK